eukprot:TRINITY_DN16595_c0_g1_i1.p1 TRINITY_DN16595_c0_g1~~TRINITY_DN16595_c0_g1_i1.p1  ORF type:complete len:343 (+),score=111.04 TRINITY_DN16595_c0_g1_i1:79-1107(+)
MENRRLYIVGGGYFTPFCIKKFHEKAVEVKNELYPQSDELKIVIVPTAKHSKKSQVDQHKDEIINLWKERGFDDVFVVNVTKNEAENNNDFHIALAEYEPSAIWFMGGSQSKIANKFVGSKTHSIFLDLADKGVLIGGTSAGAAIMSRTMIRCGDKRPQIMQGLGFIDRVIIDQHFFKRKRTTRLKYTLKKYPTHVGVGIDETTVAYFTGYSVKVYGRSKVALFNPYASENPLNRTIYTKGNIFNVDQFDDVEYVPTDISSFVNVNEFNSLKAIKQAYKEYDSDNNKKLDLNETKNFFKSIIDITNEEITDEEFEQIFNSYDLNDDGYLTFKEFLQIFSFDN